MPFFVMAQYDFETRYFTINTESLPDVPEFSALEMNWAPKKESEFKDISDFTKVTASNYWQAVDMASALEKRENYQKADIKVANLNQKFSALGGNAQYSKDGSSKVENTVYKELRGLDFLDPCPPFGICPRCAPYRMSRGY